MRFTNLQNWMKNKVKIKIKIKTKLFSFYLQKKWKLLKSECNKQKLSKIIYKAAEILTS